MSEGMRSGEAAGKESCHMSADMRMSRPVFATAEQEALESRGESSRGKGSKGKNA